jgi:outer membrane protein TolC
MKSSLAGAIALLALALPGNQAFAQPVAGSTPAPGCVLTAPILSEGQGPRLPAPKPDAEAKPLPINLATALRLAGARPLVIAAAQASVEIADAQLQRARVQWLPTFSAGGGYYHHDGATQGQSGTFYNNSKDQAIFGGGLLARVAGTEALFAPLAARQVLQSRTFDVQTARNDSLLLTAEAYFRLQQARGRLAASQDVLDRGLKLAKTIDFARLGQEKPTDLHRARTLKANFEEEIVSAREQWQIASTDLSQILRLDPTVTLNPAEGPDLSVTLISADAKLETLIPIGLTNRPELASQQALVQAAITRLRQERLRPLIPNLVVEGNPGPTGPGNAFMGGIFGSSLNGAPNPWESRDDVSIGLVWELQNLGFGNRALVRERRAERQQALVELTHIQDLVAADIARAVNQVASAHKRMTISLEGVHEAWLAYSGSESEIGKIMKVDDVSTQVRRVFEVIDALRTLANSYTSYFQAISDYNQAQFRLYRALGYAADALACGAFPAPVLP